jgi:hypothetical protein
LNLSQKNSILVMSLYGFFWYLQKYAADVRAALDAAQLAQDRRRSTPQRKRASRHRPCDVPNQG